MKRYITTVIIPSTRRLLIGLGLKKAQKPIYQARTYHYNSASTRNFGHARNHYPQIPKSPSSTVTQLKAAPELTKGAQYQYETDFNLMPGSWVDDEDDANNNSNKEYTNDRYTTATPSPPYREAKRRPLPHYQNINYQTAKSAPAAKNIKYKQLNSEPKNTMIVKRHVRSASDMFTVHHPSPQDVYG
ncbi:hypothetical protein MBM_07623 [Drepanopeziza brunnea f. sp. 'multigermtubi' MB_m1]|uniref:Uncharacterized protein n=1 Tax=Marssonina brunnea f. sp. multigermtubi (strain MB_m1) TaxID=1072389 RepID=K1X0J1_MARBU|nr:uncharacterized protein MBM_07623 [Drepanopeziza brunnea f. sp. 'multigermtubi' MB_m1]EKD14393.1 hypothetical protein MBM_07623 [Drepanopeziza brunnea f. sp. 'multigermtubi' MB_m1]